MKRDHVDIIQSQWERERPDLDSTPMGIFGRISRISRYLDIQLQENYAKFNLNAGEFDVLAALRRAGKPFQLTPTELFNSLMLSSGAMTNRLDRLEVAGLIERRPNLDDRRGTLVTLTNEGSDLIDKIYPLHLQFENKLLSSLSPQDRSTLLPLLRKLLISFEEQKD